MKLSGLRRKYVNWKCNLILHSSLWDIRRTYTLWCTTITTQGWYIITPWWELCAIVCTLSGFVRINVFALLYISETALRSEEVSDRLNGFGSNWLIKAGELDGVTAPLTAHGLFSYPLITGLSVGYPRWGPLVFVMEFLYFWRWQRRIVPPV